MSHIQPTQRYAYAQTTIPPPNYYYEDTEDIGEYSESEILSENQPGIAAVHPPDVTELYRRKVIAVGPQGPLPPAERYLHRGLYYAPPEYYYEPIAPISPIPAVPAVIRQPPMPPRRAYVAPTAYRRRIPVPDDRAGQYYSADQIDEAYARMAFRSSPQIASQSKTSPPRVPSATATPQTRKTPVTVRTPRYYRRQGLAVLKKPSTLCLPLVCQPDPGVYRRTRKPAVTDQQIQQPVHNPQEDAKRLQENACYGQDSYRMEPKGDTNAYQRTDLDSVFARYEKIFADNHRNIPATPTKNLAPEVTLSNKTNVAIVPMKPRVPSSIRAKQKTRTTKSARDPVRHAYPNPSIRSKSPARLEVEEITTEVLDNLLTELMSKTNAEGDKKSNLEKPVEQPTAAAAGDGGNVVQEPPIVKEQINAKDINGDGISLSSGCAKNSENQQPKSFNYQDISQHMIKSQSSREQQCTTSVEKEIPVELPSPPQSTYQGKIPLDPTSAMELHKSKSYIVSLIDRALSKELGTTPEAKFHKEYEYQSMDTKMAIDAMNRHIGISRRPDKDFCLEMTQALTESYTSNNNAGQSDNKTEASCPYVASGDEPVYVKQLKQLRWGHLKHIQREVRRLEDLERFLDSCSSQGNTF